MKKSSLLYAALVAASAMATASAQTVINITGATAFREAAHLAIRSSISNCVYGYQGTNFSSAGSAIFKGDIQVNSVTTPVIVRTTWSGSVAGIRAVVNQSNAVTYFSSSNSTLINSLAGGNGTLLGSTVTPSESVTTGNKICFTDNTQDNTPYQAVTLDGGPIGVIAFVPAVNETSAISANASITTLQLRSLIKAGSVPMKYVTGNVSDETKQIIWTGRNTLSGTRVIYLAETGVGVSNPVVQFKAVTSNMTDANSPITGLTYWPVEAGNNGVDVWSPTAQSGNATAGNGGYNSGGDLANVLVKAFSANVSINDASGSSYATLTSNDTALMTVLSAQELPTIVTGGGKSIAYNGYKLSVPTAYVSATGLGGLSDADEAMIINGQYTLWSYENLFYRPSGLSATETAFIDLLQTNVPAQIGGNGVTIADMKVSRSADGADISVDSVP